MTKQNLKDKFQEWKSQVDGKPVEAEDPSNLDQCFDLAFSWVDFIGIPRETIRHLYAHQIYDSPAISTGDYFDLIPNTEEAITEVGDLVVFDTWVGPAGHVSVASDIADKNSFVSEDQNWGGKQFARAVTHANYFGVSGFLRPKTTEVVVDPANSVTDDEFRALQVLRIHIQTSIDQSNNSFGNLEGYANALAQEGYAAWKALPKVQNDLDNAYTANNQQADLITELRKELAALQAKPDPFTITPVTYTSDGKPMPPPKQTRGFWKAVGDFLGYR